MNASSGIVVSRPAIAASPTPGNTYTLFAWLIATLRLFNSTGSNGEPVATIALPLLQASASTGVISAHEVGLESGQINGADAIAAIARIEASSNAPDRSSRVRGTKMQLLSHIPSSQSRSPMKWPMSVLRVKASGAPMAHLAFRHTAHLCEVSP